MDASLDDPFIKDAPESDEDLDAFNSDTFGDGNDQWDWESQQEPENLPSNDANRSSLDAQLHSSIIHTSKGHIGSLPPLPDVSVIRSVADLEKDFLRESLDSTQTNASLDSTPKTLDRALLSIDQSKVFHLSDLEDTMRRESDVKVSPPVHPHGTSVSSSLPLHSSNLSSLRPLPDMSTIKSVSEIEADLLASSDPVPSSSEKVWPQGGKSLDEIESELFGLNLNSSSTSTNSTRSPSKAANTSSNNNSLSVFPNLADSSIWAPPEYSSIFPPLGSDAVTPSPVDSNKSNAQRGPAPDARVTGRPSGDANLIANVLARNMPQMTGIKAQGQPAPGQPFAVNLVPQMPGFPMMPMPVLPGPPGSLPMIQIANQRPQFMPIPVRPGMPLIPLLPNGQRFPLPVAPINVHHAASSTPAIRQLFPPQIHHPNVQMVNVNSCQPTVNDVENNRNADQYAGLMTQDERKWLTKIQRLQLEGSMTDPYVDDYYSMAYQAKKIEQSRSRENKAKNKDPIMIVEMTGKNTPQSNKHASSESNVSTPNNCTPNQRIAAAYTPRQYEGSLGKLQAVNLKCPRKLLDLPSLEEVTNDPGNSGHMIDESAPLAKKELRKLRLLLMDIERLYLILLKIDYIDKRMAALPEEGQKELADSRKSLCQQLFDGITTKPNSSPDQQNTPSKSQSNQGRSQQLKMLLDTMTNTKLAQKNEASIDLTSHSRPKLHSKIASIRKGATLIFRSLSIFKDAHHKAVLIADLIDSGNFHLVVLQKDKSLYGLDYAEILIDSLISLEQSVSVDVLLLLSQGLNDASNVARYPCGEEIIQQILHLSSVFLTKFSQQITPDFAQRWEAFLLELTDEVDDVPDLRKLVLTQQKQLKSAHSSFSRPLPNGSPLRR